MCEQYPDRRIESSINNLIMIQYHQRLLVPADRSERYLFSGKISSLFLMFDLFVQSPAYTKIFMNPISLRPVVQLKNLCDNMCDNSITRQDVP